MGIQVSEILIADSTRTLDKEATVVLQEGVLKNMNLWLSPALERFWDSTITSGNQEPQLNS